ncbi:MAG TPA: replicative DNA helicase [Candidatus Portnoybacteria bacterium]|nr:replicative DNA helicase [Candidatus Portnoybacteria bacterium]
MSEVNSPQINRLPPQNIDAEKAVLGSLMINKEAISQVADLLKPEDFYRPSHGIIYQAIVSLYGKSEPIDLVSLSNYLQEKGRLDEIGGVSYLTNLTQATPTAAHIVHYAKIVRRKKVLRDLITAASEITELTYQNNANIEKLLDQVEQRIFAISQRSINYEFVSVKSALEEAFERIDRLQQNKDHIRGVPTGFDQLDNLLSGLQRSDLVVLAARPSIGKSSLALDIARYVGVREKIPVAVFSLEMSKQDLVDRLIASEANINLWKLRTGRLIADGPNNDFERIQEALSSLAESTIFIDDNPSPTVLQMKTMSRRLKAKYPLGLIIIDYLQLIQPLSSTDNRVQQVSEISRALKGLAREINVPVLALSQLSRAIESRPDQYPRLADLRESGSIEQDSDVVMFIYREDKVKKNSTRPNIADLIVAKHRNGPLGKIELYFDETQAAFKNLERKME